VTNIHVFKRQIIDFLNIQRKFVILIAKIWNFVESILKAKFPLKDSPTKKYFFSRNGAKMTEIFRKIFWDSFLTKIDLTENSFVGAWLIFLVWIFKKISKFFDQKNDHWRHVAYLDIKSGALINFFTVLEVNRAVLNSQKFYFR